MRVKYRSLSLDKKIKLYKTTLKNLKDNARPAKIMTGIGFNKGKFMEAELLLKETIALYDLQKQKEEQKLSSANDPKRPISFTA